MWAGTIWEAIGVYDVFLEFVLGESLEEIHLCSVTELIYIVTTMYAQGLKIMLSPNREEHSPRLNSEYC